MDYGVHVDGPAGVRRRQSEPEGEAAVEGAALRVVAAARRRVLDSVVITGAVVWLILLVSSLLRALDLGWRPVMYIHTASYAVWLSVALLRRRLSFRVQAACILAVLYALGVAGVLAFGLLAQGTIALTLCTVFAVLLFGRRGGLAAAAASAAAVGVIAVGFHLGLVTPDVDIAAAQRSPWVWVHSAVGMGVVLAYLVTGVSRVHEALLAVARKAAEGQAREEARAAELEGVLDTMPAGVVIAHDAAGDRVTANRRTYQLLGLPDGANLSRTNPQSPAGWTSRLLHDGAEIPFEDLPLYRALRGTEVGEQEMWVESGDGARYYLVGNGAPLCDEQGRIRGAVATYTDITARKQAEDALREAGRRKDEFLAMLSHELRNPLAAIRAALFVLGVRGQDDPMARRASESADRQMRHVVRMVDDLLDVARITRGTMQLHKERVRVSTVVEMAAQMIAPRIEAKHLQTIVRLPDDYLEMDADPARLAQVLANLLDNAAKFTDSGGRIWLEAAREGDQAVVRVRDSGLGIDAELLPRIFEPFTQEKQALARVSGGLGLGLSVVRGLVEMHGGSVEAHSAGPGQGSEFVVRLPLAPA